MAAFVFLAFAVPSLVRAQSETDCGCIDLALVIDDTGSMGGAIGNIQAGLADVIATAQLISDQDTRFAVVTFKDDIDVDLPFTNDVDAVTAIVDALVASGGDGGPEASDEAMRLTVTGNTSPAADCTVNDPDGPLGGFRFECVKIAVLVTDNLPGGCNDDFVDGIDDVNAAEVADAAAAAGILISSLQTGGGSIGTLADIMKYYADATGGVYTLLPASGAGASDAITSILQKCGEFVPPEIFLPTSRPSQHPFCITRDVRYWATHAYSNDPTGATLLLALEASDRPFALGFLGLPTEFRNADNVKDEYDAVIEALGLFYRGVGKTGESGGTQRDKLKGSKLCKERKKTVRELIATIANNALLGTGTENCSYVDGGAVTNFPADLIEQAGEALVGVNIDRIREMRVLLKKFNNSGTINDFVGGLTEPSPVDKKILKNLSRDPSTQATCPGLNDSCSTSLRLASFPHRETVNTQKYNNTTGGATCQTGGPEAIWRIEPEVAVAGRSFLVNTEGSNFDTVISVREEFCNPLNEIACNDDIARTNSVAQIFTNLQSELVFTANGTNTYFIVIDGKNGAYGKLKVRVESF